MKNVIISGPDGTGKSTITNALSNILKKENIDVNSVWLRFNHYSAKIVNLIGRLLKKSFYEKYEWGKVGYHNYEGKFGYLYIYAIYIDHIIFDKFFRNRILNSTKLLLIDRYIIDIAADLIVDTNKATLVVKLFKKYIEKEMHLSKTFILRCDPAIVKLRREDIKDDKNYLKKVSAYQLLAKEFNITTLNTGDLTPDEIIEIIIEQ